MTKITQLLILFQCLLMFGQVEQTLTLGSGTSSSATRGPFQRSDSGSGSVFSRASMVYSATELAGLTSTTLISQINFDLGETNIITASGDATMLIYMKNTSATDVAPVDTEWSTVIAGATLVGTYTFNTTNNFTGAKGFMDFELDSDFAFAGDALEVLIDWDCSGLVPADPGQPNLLFSDDGSLNWRWDDTAHASLLYDASSSAPTALDTRKTQRVNTQFVYIINIPLSVAQNAFPSEFLLAPNPASDYTTIKTDETIDSVELYDMLGKKVKASVIGNRINVSTLPSALYLVKISSANGVAVKRLLKR